MKSIANYAPRNAAIELSATAGMLFGAVLAGLMLFPGASLAGDKGAVEATASSATGGAGPGQTVYATPEEAADAFTSAVRNNDREMMEKVLGENYRDVLPLDDVDAEDVENYLAAWDAQHSLLPDGDNKRLIAVGKGDWTMPLPVVSGPNGWHFDLQEGLERMLIRAIGRNELSAMQAVMAYYDAQLEYAEQDRNGDGRLEYAQRIISTPGKKDGLYWEVTSEEAPSPLGPLMGDQTPGGGYYGYYYRILTAQGEHAEGGARSYMMGDAMRSGFALVAWPQEYGETGVMSFIVSHSGIVYEQDLGADGTADANAITTFDPGPGWEPVKELQGS